MNRPIFTTSWDDGSIYDLKLMDMLVKYGVKGTFYVPIKNSEREGDILTFSQIREIDSLFEIGCHTYNHKNLTSISYHEALEEIKQGKKLLEEIIGKEVKAFCFPKGKFNNLLLSEIINLGFDFARTTGYLRIKNIIDKQSHLMHTTLQVYPHKYHNYFISAIKRQDLEAIPIIIKNIKSIQDWTRFAISLLDYAEKTNGIFHLWGHSWEIEENNLWTHIREFFEEIKIRKSFTFVTNSELWKMIYESL